MTVRGVSHHLVAYITIDDLISNASGTPSGDPNLASIMPRSELLSQGFRAPLEQDDQTEILSVVNS